MLALNAKTSADQVLASRDLSDKLAIVTGANTGIGFETARSLAAAGAHVIFACRSSTTGEAAVQRTRSCTLTARLMFARWIWPAPAASSHLQTSLRLTKSIY